MGSGYNNSGDKAIDRFAEMMIRRMEDLKNADWKKGWIGGDTPIAMPQNISGRSYSGSNSFFLQLESAVMGYRLPVFLTFNQAHKLDAHILKGSKAFPVMYWDVILRDNDGNKISREDYRNMSEDEKKKVKEIPFLKTFPVYNVSQTNLKEVKPELYEKLQNRFKAPQFRDTLGMYENKELDRLVGQNEWVCPIHADKPSSQAYYSPARDIVVVPMKKQFNMGGTEENIYAGGMEYYSTLLHEMTHSTMKPDRLNRTAGGKFGDEKYAKEELVAELTAAMIGNSLGFDRKITDNSAAYLENWIAALKQEPRFILSVMADVNKASDMILSYIDRQRIALGMAPLQCKTENAAKSRNADLPDIPEVTVQRTKKGETSVRMSMDGVALGIKPLTKHETYTYHQLADRPEGKRFIENLAARKFENEIKNVSAKKESCLKI